jgi:hypothetical protein
VTIQDLGSLGEFVAAVATIATLVFLAVQIRHSTDAARTSAELELPQQFAEWHARVSAHPELARIWDAAAEDFGSLGPDEIRKFRWLVSELFLVFEGQYYAYRGGLLSEPSWMAKRDTMLALLENRILTEWWSNRLTPFSEEFRQEIEAHRGRSEVSWVHQSVAGNSSSAALRSDGADAE